MAKTVAGIKVADEVWIAAALLHEEQPDKADFTVQEIVARARSESLHGDLRPGVQIHVYSHCVANIAPTSGRYRMLFATGKTRRRLYRSGDLAHPARRGGKALPARSEIPPAYHRLLDWYLSTYSAPRTEDPILSLRGLGKRIWNDEDPDAYVARLREGWA